MISLDFTPTEYPPWRPTSAPSTSAMIADIATASARLDSLPAHIGLPLRARIQRLEAVAFVLNSNRMEQVGTQDDASTQKLCECAASMAATEDRKSSETVQTFLALQRAHKLRGEMRAALSEDGAPPHHILMLSPGYQCEIHAELMVDLVALPGSYRTAESYPSGYNFLYASPETIENRVLVWTDAVNDILFSLPTVTLPNAFKLAALVLFNALDVHPFQDGNGRLCRILASGMLSEHHFFPVYLQPLTTPCCEGSHQHLAWRSIYIDAIEACRRDAAHRPSDLAALLVESSWAVWTRVQGLVAECVDETGAPLLGSIVLGKRMGQEARERVSSRWASLCHSRRLGGKPEGAAAREEDIDRLCAAAGGGGAPARVHLQDGSVVCVFA